MAFKKIEVEKAMTKVRDHLRMILFFIKQHPCQVWQQREAAPTEAIQQHLQETTEKGHMAYQKPKQ